MKFYLKLIFLNVFGLTMLAQAHSAVDPQIIERIKKAIEPQIGKQTIGTVIGIYDRGSVEFIYLGEKSVGQGLPHKDTLFEIASITKTFTSLMFSIAIDKGLVTSETTLGEIRPEWKNQKLGSITLLELATHRSGLMRLPCDFEYEDPSNPYKDYTEKQLIESISDERISSIEGCEIQTHPTQQIIYSNWGSALLANAIGARAHLSFPEMLKNWITDPLKMNDTVVNLNSEQLNRLAQGYTYDFRPIGLWDRLGMMGNGAISSTSNDLLIYARAMIYPDQTPFANSIRRVQVRQFSVIAYNWFVTPSQNIWHDGISGGYTSLMKVYPTKEFAVVNLSNTEVPLKCIIEAVENTPCIP